MASLGHWPLLPIIFPAIRKVMKTHESCFQEFCRICGSTNGPRETSHRRRMVAISFISSVDWPGPGVQPRSFGVSWSVRRGEDGWWVRNASRGLEDQTENQLRAPHGFGSKPNSAGPEHNRQVSLSTRGSSSCGDTRGGTTARTGMFSSKCFVENCGSLGPSQRALVTACCLE